MRLSSLLLAVENCIGLKIVAVAAYSPDFGKIEFICAPWAVG